MKNKNNQSELSKSDSRAKQIIDALSNKDQDKLKELKVSKEEVEKLLKSIDKKIEKLDSEIAELSKPDSRAKQIIDALSNKDQDKLKELKVSKEEAEKLLKSIDKKIEELDSEISKY